MEAIAGHFRLGFTARQIEAIVGGPIFRSHAKSGERFDIRQREDELREAQGNHGDEISMVVAWSGKVAEAAGSSLELKAPLLG
jgi:hypothetical protein